MVIALESLLCGKNGPTGGSRAREACCTLMDSRMHHQSGSGVERAEAGIMLPQPILHGFGGTRPEPRRWW